MICLYSISGKWDERTYKALLQLAANRGTTCVLVQRRDATPGCAKWLEANSSSFEGKAEVMRWPGTVVYSADDAVTLYKFRVTKELVKNMLAVTQTPFEWIGPELPEDLAFLRADGRPWFVSIAHEQDAFFKLEPAEVPEVSSYFPARILEDQGEDLVPDERY